MTSMTKRAPTQSDTGSIIIADPSLFFVKNDLCIFLFKDMQQELEQLTKELRQVNLQQFIKQTGTKVTVLPAEPAEEENSHKTHGMRFFPILLCLVIFILHVCNLITYFYGVLLVLMTTQTSSPSTFDYFQILCMYSIHMHAGSAVGNTS